MLKYRSQNSHHVLSISKKNKNCTAIYFIGREHHQQTLWKATELWEPRIFTHQRKNDCASFSDAKQWERIPSTHFFLTLCEYSSAQWWFFLGFVCCRSRSNPCNLNLAGSNKFKCISKAKLVFLLTLAVFSFFFFFTKKEKNNFIITLSAKNNCDFVLGMCIFSSLNKQLTRIPTHKLKSNLGWHYLSSDHLVIDRWAAVNAE